MYRFGAIKQSTLILLTALFISVFHNYTFFNKVALTYPTEIAFQLSIYIVFFCLLNIFLNVFALGRAAKTILIAVVLFSAIHAYFTDSFGSIGDDTMIRNILKTDTAEVTDLFNFKLFAYLFFLGLLPAALLYIVRLKSDGFKKNVLLKFRSVGASVLVIIISLVSFGKSYASFFREHKPLRYYANPMYFAYSSFKIIEMAFSGSDTTLAALGEDAKTPREDTERELIIFVMGETARSDHFSLNGYKKETNPKLKKEKVISFTDVYSCGTSTATSLPCLFSAFGREAFTHEHAEHTENILDILKHTDQVSILWRDNNSDSKGVAVRVPYEDYKSPKVNTVCDVECRDEGMLVGLQNYIDTHSAGDIFIVLHQMGNHGPAYYKRYPAAFEVFKPTCKSSDLGDCTDEEISNAYDNAIVYTDHFLSQVINFLKKNDPRFEAAMFYVSDHGESLGENGIYLHGLPYSIAPIEQRKVPLVLWFGEGIKKDINVSAVQAKVGQKFTHDNVFHTILGLMEVKTAVYDKSKDIVVHNEEH